MKLYDFTAAPNPRRARIFIAEKGIDVETVQVDLMHQEQLTDAFRAINPRCTVPVLELDDGTCIAENVGIAQYLEDINPDPLLLGTTPVERAQIWSWNARCEFDGISAIGESFRNQTPGFKTRALTGPSDYPQIPELVERGARRAQEFFAVLDAHFGAHEYVVGDAYSMADITALVAIDFAAWIKVSIGEDQTHLRRWHDAVSARPSAKA